jgi:hypothetical protein
MSQPVKNSSSRWLDFVKKNAGKGMSMKQISMLYREQYTVPHRKKPSRCVGRVQGQCPSQSVNLTCFWRKHPKTPHCAKKYISPPNNYVRPAPVPRPAPMPVSRPAPMPVSRPAPVPMRIHHTSKPLVLMPLPNMPSYRKKPRKYPTTYRGAAKNLLPKPSKSSELPENVCAAEKLEIEQLRNALETKKRQLAAFLQ